jgi:hypothetical protein
VQLASYDSTFTTGDASIDGPGKGFEVDCVWPVDGGFDARLGEHWTLGVTAAFAGALYPGVRSLETGLHLGYGWN